MLQFMLRAIKNRINDVAIPAYFNKELADCQITSSGHPTVSYRGILFIALHGGKAKLNEDSNQGDYLDETYYFKTTVSMKTANVPRYRFGDLNIEDPVDGITYANDIVKAVIHNANWVWQDASELMLQTFPTADPFLADSPCFLSQDEAIEQTSTWFGAKLEDKGTTAGLSITSSFSGLRLIRHPSAYLPSKA